MNTDIDIYFKNALKKLTIIYVIVFIMILSLSFGFFYFSKSNYSQTITQGIRNTILVQDWRTISVQLNNLVPKVFDGITIQNHDGTIMYSLPENFTPSWGLITTVTPIYTSLNSTDVKYEVKYFFDYRIVTLIAFLLGIILFLTFMPVFNKIKFTVNEKYQIEIKLKNSENIQLLARQVSHDIRSPLSALNIAMSSLNQIPEEKRSLIHNAVQRINNIANNLLEQSKNPQTSLKSTPSQINHPFKTLSLTTLLSSILSEKRLQLHEHSQVKIECDLKDSYGLFVEANATEFHRLISNLINNSVEAFENSTEGKIYIFVRSYSQQISVIVKDNGRGIPSELLPKLGEIGFSEGKIGTESGSGLGLFHAKKTISEMKGQLQITSQVGVGTIVTITLPKAQPPKWFCPEIILNPSQTIVVLDDDPSIHMLWKDRLQNLKTAENKISLVCFSSSTEFKNWPNKNNKCLYLFDYELTHQSQTGLEIIKELNLASQAMLVTSHFEDDKIISAVEELHIKIVPKNIIDLVPITIVEPTEKL